MESPTLIYLPGDGYTEATARPFLNFLNQHGIRTIYVPLQEENENCTYDQISPENYCKYIDCYVSDLRGQVYGYGISKGEHWIRMYAARNPGKIKKLILVEGTCMTPKLMVQYEHSRGNDYVEDLYEDPVEHEEMNATDKALDAIVSDKGKYAPKNIPIHIVFTSRNNQNEPYSADVIALKNQYVNELRRAGCQVRVHKFNSDHCIDTHPQYFPALLSIIESK